jgi:hypothetical protein
MAYGREDERKFLARVSNPASIVRPFNGMARVLSLC